MSGRGLGVVGDELSLERWRQMLGNRAEKGELILRALGVMEVSRQSE